MELKPPSKCGAHGSKSFLSLAGYYRKFIPDLLKVAAPMTRYLKKGAKINPKDPEYITAFEELKLLISSDPVLKYPDFSKEFLLTTDASNSTIGSVLSQSSHSISYACRTINERSYSTKEKELLLICSLVNKIFSSIPLRSQI